MRFQHKRCPGGWQSRQSDAVWITGDFPSDRVDKGGQQASHGLAHTKSPVTPTAPSEKGAGCSRLRRNNNFYTQ